MIELFANLLLPLEAIEEERITLFILICLTSERRYHTDRYVGAKAAGLLQVVRFQYSGARRLVTAGIPA